MRCGKSQAPDRAHNLVVVSDLHLGEQVPGESQAQHRERLDKFDSDFAEFLAFYSAPGPGGCPWKLIINGDMIDFMRVSGRVEPPGETGTGDLETADRSGDDSTGGSELGPSHNVAGALVRLQAVFEAHHRAFDALGRFLAMGNGLALVVGNHDLELLWTEVQDALLQRLVETARSHVRAPSEGTDAELARRVSFLPWFYYEPGTLYIEHGHMYDRYCNTEEFLNPPETRDGPSFSHIAVRYGANLADGLPSHGLDTWDIRDYFAWFFRLGLAPAIAMVWRTMVMMTRLTVEALRGQFGRSGGAAHEEGEASELVSVAQSGGLSLQDAEELRRLAPRPLLTSVLGTIQGVFLDRFLFVFVVALAVAGTILAPGSALLRAVLLTAISVAALAVWRHLARSRPASSVAPILGEVARRISEILAVRVVVLGHSHQPGLEVLDGDQGTLYYNLGAWANLCRDEDGAEDSEGARVGAPYHLAVERRRGRRASVSLRRWMGSGVVEADEGLLSASCDHRPT